MSMHNPSHPGRLLEQRLIEGEDGQKLNSIAMMAEQLGCHWNTLNRVMNCSASLRPEMVLALELIGAGKAEFWLGMQASYDLFQLRRAGGVA